MKAYDSLSTFPDVSPALKALGDEAWITPVVFSNGTSDMVRNSVLSSEDLGPHAMVFKSIITVDDVKRFKPDPAVYYHLAEKVGKSKEDMKSIWLVSSNPFDVVGAAAVGMKTAWVNRGGGVWADRLVREDTSGPTIIVNGLGEVIVGVDKVNSVG